MGKSIFDDPEWKVMRWRDARYIDNRVRWPLVWWLMKWIIRLAPKTPAGDVVVHTIGEAHRGFLPIVAAEVDQNWRMLAEFSRRMDEKRKARKRG